MDQHKKHSCDFYKTTTVLFHAIAKQMTVMWEQK